MLSVAGFDDDSDYGALFNEKFSSKVEYIFRKIISASTPTSLDGSLISITLLLLICVPSVLQLSIPMRITQLEKKMTALIIPNAIQITTRQAKYTFASFLSRDTTYDVIYIIWRLARPDEGGASSRPSLDGSSIAPSERDLTSEVPVPGVTGSKYNRRRSADAKGRFIFSETALDCILRHS